MRFVLAPIAAMAFAVPAFADDTGPLMVQIYSDPTVTNAMGLYENYAPDWIGKNIAALCTDEDRIPLLRGSSNAICALMGRALIGGAISAIQDPLTSEAETREAAQNCFGEEDDFELGKFLACSVITGTFAQLENPDPAKTAELLPSSQAAQEVQLPPIAEQDQPLTDEELEEERRLMAALMDQMREQYELDRQKRDLEARERETRNFALRREQLAALDANASNNSSLDRIFQAAEEAVTTQNGFELTQTEAQSMLDQLRRCWRVDTFSANARSLVTTFSAEIRENGFIDQASITLLSPDPLPSDFQIAADRARTALQDLRCQPFSLSPQKYNAWKEITIRFDPVQMVLQ